MRTRTSFVRESGAGGRNLFGLEIDRRIHAAAVEPSACFVDLCEIERIPGRKGQLPPHKIRPGVLVSFDGYVANQGLPALDDIKSQVRPGRGGIEDNAERDRDLIVAFAVIQGFKCFDRVLQACWDRSCCRLTWESRSRDRRN